MMTPDEKPTIVIERDLFCERHRRDLLAVQMRLGPNDLWLATEFTARLLMFQLATSDERIWKRAEKDAANLSLTLAELGCLACWSPEYYERMLRIMRRGLSHAAQVAQNKASDPDSPFRDVKPAEPK